jgi:hypothetical protein
MVHHLLIRRAAHLRREVAVRERTLYGARFDDAVFLRRRGFAVHIESTTAAGRRFRLGNRSVSGTELRAVAARERRLLKLARKGI